jgi:hypothetical protein
MLFHSRIYIPAAIELPGGPLRLTYSKHALHKAADNYNGDITSLLPEILDPADAELIEVETDANLRLIKVVYRLEVRNELFDIVLAIQTDRNLVRTVWTNDVRDEHRSLRKARYVGAPV